MTEVTPYTNFYQAEDYHQDATTTININPGYITYNDLPKIENLKVMFPEVWRDEGAAGLRQQRLVSFATLCQGRAARRDLSRRVVFSRKCAISILPG